MENLHWFTGKIVDIDDPLKAGRVRVLIHGHHSELGQSSIKKGIGVDKECLPWAIPVQSVVSAANSGTGISPVGYDIDTQVFGISTSQIFDNLFILGTIAGAPAGVSDIPEVSQGIEDAITKNKNDNKKNSVSIAGGGTWSEPSSPFAAEYPHNKAFKTKSGHLIEIDDTDGAERINVYHKSGTFFEMHPDGDYQIRCIKDNYEVNGGNKNISVSGDINISASNCNIKADDSCFIDAAGTVTVNAQSIETTSNGLDIIVAGDTKIVSTGELDVSTTSRLKVTAAGGFDIYGATTERPSTIQAAGGILLVGNRVVTV